jgi:hypothetical protein
VKNLDNALNSTIDVTGINTAVLIVDATSSDGCIIEEVYSISRDAYDSAETINLYLSTGSDYLRPGEGILVGTFQSGTTAGAVTTWDTAPKILAPVPHVADVPTGTAAYDLVGETPETVAPVAATGKAVQLRALYVPKGRALWAARQSDSILTNGPLIGCQGGWY